MLRKVIHFISRLVALVALLLVARIARAQANPNGLSISAAHGSNEIAVATKTP